MKHKNDGDHELSPAEVRLIQQLREHPEMLGRLGSILDLTCRTDGPLKTADEVEELLIQELRRLGHTSITQWAKQAEARVSDELTRQDPTLRSRKKKVLKWWCVFGEVAVRDRVWCSLTQRYVRPLPQRLGVRPRGRSRRLQRVLTDFGCEHSFARAADSVLEHYGLVLGSTAVRTGHLDPCASGAGETGGAIRAAVSGAAGCGGPTRHYRDGRHDDLHGSAGSKEEQTSAGLEGDATGGSASQGQCDDLLRSHLWECDPNRAAVGTLVRSRPGGA